LRTNATLDSSAVQGVLSRVPSSFVSRSVPTLPEKPLTRKNVVLSLDSNSKSAKRSGVA
jgi:hypothetical protein